MANASEGFGHIPVVFRHYRELLSDFPNEGFVQFVVECVRLVEVNLGKGSRYLLFIVNFVSEDQLR
ncbi:hypothetical protein, partial [Lactococcus petauri]|uniref:hypothetical protein n=1 Tax=Lactococcus petauri TaxID=1940789 RepID=UPI0021F0CF9F